MTDERSASGGSIVLLVGPSSVGKTAVARELQRALRGLWLTAGVDLFWGTLDERSVGEFRTDSAAMRRVTRGWHRAVAALAHEGNNVIVDELWLHRWWLSDWSEALAGLRWWSVRLTAGVAELARREAVRGDRPAGLAAGDAANAPGGDDRFDLVLDTGEASAAECAAAIAALVGRSSAA
jgi:chloramphenicol 3-O phosphotransferase